MMMSEDGVVAPVPIAESGAHEKLKSYLHHNPSSPGTDSSTDDESDYEQEQENDSDTETEKGDMPPSHSGRKTEGPKGEGLQKEPQEQTRRIPTQPRVDGDLSIHRVIECSCEVMTCQFNPEGTLLALGLNEGTIKLYKPGTGEFVKTIRDSSCIFASMPVTSIRFFRSAQANSLILATYASGHVRCWYVWGGECVWSVKEAKEVVEGGGVEGEGAGGGSRQTLCMSVSCSNEQAATGGSDATVQLYDLATHQVIQAFKPSSTRTIMDGHRLRVFALAFHPEREREFISGGWDNTVQFWDTRQPHAVRMLSGPHICGDALQIDPFTHQILSGSWRKSHNLEVWEYGSAEKNTEVPPDPHGCSKIYSCHWLGRDHIVAAGSQQNMLRVINRHTLKTVGSYMGLSSAVCSSAVCPAGEWAGLIAATTGNRVCLLQPGGQRTKRPTL
ncbi:uncharacterized protein LOC134467353 [Engraulis encrasicolus]|uniref:uncharacterized protein LOC134467353 n=1 Tax=Engraulis encrasicolus TaxID=184585 RepID=UPI002FD254C4